MWGGCPLKVPASSGFSAGRARSSGQRGAPARGDRGWGPRAQHADGGQVDLRQPASPGRRGGGGCVCVGTEGGGSLALLRDQNRRSKIHARTTIATLPCAAAARPWKRHPEGCTDRRPRIPDRAPARPRARSATLVRTCSGFQCGRSSWMRRRAPGRMSSWSTDMPKQGTAAALGAPGGSRQPAPAAAFSSMPHEHCGHGACRLR